MLVMLFGIVREPVKPEHPLNVKDPIDEIVFGRVSVPVKPLQLRNAPVPKLVMLFGILRLPISPEHPRNASLPIVVTSLPMKRAFSVV